MALPLPEATAILSVLRTTAVCIAVRVVIQWTYKQTVSCAITHGKVVLVDAYFRLCNKQVAMINVWKARTHQQGMRKLEIGKRDILSQRNANQHQLTQVIHKIKLLRSENIRNICNIF